MYVISDRFCSYKKGEIGGDGQVYVGGHIQDIPCTWWIPWLAVECPWSALTGLTLLLQMDVETSPFSLTTMSYKYLCIAS